MGANAGDRNRQGFCVIMAGGKGTRFWPLSRSRQPKQLLALSSGRTLLRETCQRLLPLVGPERVLIVTNADLAAATARELPELPSANIIAEPVGRNTAPCAALGIGIAERLGGPGPVALLPADHWIPDVDIFRQQLQAAFEHAAATGEAVTFGIPATRAETGYGYLETAGAAESAEASPVGDEPLRGLRFVEKPDPETAASYLATGRHYWNSGIFVWESRAFASALAEHLPDVSGLLAGPLAAFGSPDFSDTLAAAYQRCESLSIDKGVMEKLTAFAVYEAAFRWSDLGSWDAWGTLASRLDAGNRGRTELFAIESRDNVVYAPEKAVALIGVAGLIVVDTSDAILICRGDSAQKIRKLTALLAEHDRQDLL